MSKVPAPQRLAIAVDDEIDHIQGPAGALVTLVEFGDFECPHCRAAHYMLRELWPRFADRVRLVYRHFPLVDSHPHAQRAAEASEAAGAQGRFWEMHDTLFDNQHALEDADLLDYARALAMDEGRFDRELSDGDFAQRVEDDLQGGVRSGVHGTPTFFINGRRLDGGWEAEAILAAIDDAAAYASADPAAKKSRKK